MRYSDIVERRRRLSVPGYLTLQDVGFDGDWVCPYQKGSHSRTGPALVGHYWYDAVSIERRRAILTKQGYDPDLMFNKVLDRALVIAGLSRSEIYVTQAFLLVPPNSTPPESFAVERSFAEVTKYELDGRYVVALGTVPSAACRRHGVGHRSVCSPSAPRRSIEDKAQEIASALRGWNAGFRQ